MQNTHKSVVLRVLFTVLVSIFSLGCEQKDPQIEAEFEVDHSLCNFQAGACVKTIGNSQLALTISPWNSPSEKPLTLSLRSSEALENVSVRIEGRDMFMGIIPVNLTEVGKNSYQAPLIYGSCSSGYMVWQAIVSYQQAGTDKFAIFEFLADSDKHSQ